MVAERTPITYPVVSILIIELERQEAVKRCPLCDWPMVFNLNPYKENERCINLDCPGRTVKV